MAKFETEDLLGAIFALNFSMLEALISQGVADRDAFLRFFQGILDRQDTEPLLPSVSYVVSTMIEKLKLGGSVSQVTLQ